MGRRNYSLGAEIRSRSPSRPVSPKRVKFAPYSWAVSDISASGDSVTFVIPTWKSDGFVVPAVLSALSQSNMPVEVVLVLDGPVRLSREDFPANAQLEVVERQFRGGPAAARNAGLRRAGGTHIAVLDADDLSDSGRAEMQLAVFASQADLVLVGSSVRLVDAGGNRIGHRMLDELSVDAVPRQLLVRNPMVHSATMFRRSPLESVGGYDESLSRFIDYDLYLRLALAGQPMCVTSDIVGSHRIHGDRLSSRPISREVRKRIIERRTQLATRLGVNRISTLARNTAWLLANSRLRPS